MPATKITPQRILDAIELVPEDRWDEVLQTIESLQTKPLSEAKENAQVRTGTDLLDSELIGIWADRTDIQNGQEFARGLRRQAEQRDEGTLDAARH